MAKIYSKDFRECVVQNVLDGMSRKDAIQIFKIGSDTLSRWLKTWQEKADLSPPKRGRYNSKRFSDPDLIEFIKSNNDSTLEEIAKHFEVSHMAIFRRLKILNITRKKNYPIR